MPKKTFYIYKALLDKQEAGTHIQAGFEKMLIAILDKRDIHTYVISVNVDAYSPN